MPKVSYKGPCVCLHQVYQRLDQPITALKLFKQGLDHFPGEVTLLTGIARIHEVQYVTVILTRFNLVLTPKYNWQNEIGNHLYCLFCAAGDEQHPFSHRVLQRCPEAGQHSRGGDRLHRQQPLLHGSA